MKSPWVYAIILFFVVIFGAGAVTVYLASSTHLGVIEERAYEKGLAYQQEIDAEQRLKNLGWKVRFSVRTEAEAKPLVLVELLDAEGVGVSGLEPELSMRFPSNGGFDSQVKLKEDPTSSGTYLGEVNTLRPGLWLLVLSLRFDGEQLLWKSRELVQ